MSGLATEQPILLDRVLGVDVQPGLVDIRGRIIRDGVVECEAAGMVQRGHSLGTRSLVGPPIADCYWYETTMETHERQRPAAWH